MPQVVGAVRIRLSIKRAELVHPTIPTAGLLCRGISKPVQQRGAAHALREDGVQSNGQGSQKGGARYKNYCRKSMQAWRSDLKELVPELLRARGYCRPEIVKRVLLY